jgi:hypothetical protein
VLFYLTVSTTQLHIFEGLEDFSQPRKVGLPCLIGPISK